MKCSPKTTSSFWSYPSCSYLRVSWRGKTERKNDMIIKSPNRVEITERSKPGEQKKEQMNLFNKIFSSPSLMWTLATILVTTCLTIAFGLKVACVVFAIWITISLIGYFVTRVAKYGD